ncbi:MAG TPA: hypothetical protein VF763_03865 [Candidatus Limnocylindrales bacterium]
MPAPDRATVLAAILEIGFVPTFTSPEPDAAFGVVRACVAGGARVVEFTNRGEGAPEVFRVLAPRVRDELPEAILGAGTILDAPTAAGFIAAGARFIVSPIVDDDTIRLCNARRIACLPGAFTPTEIARAEALGCEIVKLFPQAAIDGPAFVRSVLGPMPATRLMPTNVTFSAEALAAWFGAGAAAVGLGPGLITPETVAGRDEAGLRERVRHAAAWVDAARAGGDGR